jgi:hypothetical protein
LLIGAMRDCEENLVRNRRHGALSAGQSLQIHGSAGAVSGDFGANPSSVNVASEVTQQPVFSSGVDGHDPSESCEARKNARPRWMAFAEPSEEQCKRPSKAQQVDSARLADPE